MHICFDDPWTGLAAMGIYLKGPPGMPPSHLHVNRVDRIVYVVLTTLRDHGNIGKI